MRGAAGFRAASAFLIALAASCAAAQQAASTITLSATHGETNSSGSHVGAIGDGRASYAGTSRESGDFDALTLSISPFVALDRRDETRDALHALASEMRASRVETLPPSAPFAPASVAKLADGRRVLVHDDTAEILDPLEPLNATPTPASAPKPEEFGSSQASTETPPATASSGVPTEVWVAVAAVLTALATWLGKKRVDAAHDECATSGAPRPSLVAAALRGRNAGRRAPAPKPSEEASAS